MKTIPEMITDWQAGKKAESQEERDWREGMEEVNRGVPSGE